MMEITFQMTKEDWAQALGKIKPKSKIDEKDFKILPNFLAWIGIFCLFLIIFWSLRLKGSARVINIIFAGIMLCTIILQAISPRLFKIIKGKIWIRVPPRLLLPMTVGISEDHYFTRVQYEECSSVWEHLSRIELTEAFIIFEDKNRQFIFIPRKAFPTPEEGNEFYNLAVVFGGKHKIPS